MKKPLSVEVTKLLYSILDYELRVNDSNAKLSSHVVHHHIENLIEKIMKKDFDFDLKPCDELTIKRIACSTLITNEELVDYFMLTLIGEEEVKKF